MTPRLSALLECMAPVVRREILRDFIPNCCIATCAILRRVFRHYRLESFPLAVEVVIRNPKMVALIERGVPIPSRPDAMREWFAATGAHSVGIVKESPGEFAGHLVTRVQDVFVDASLAQANRPHKNIKLPAFIVAGICPGFLEGGKAQVAIVNGCEVLYTRLNDATWRTSPDWTNETRSRRAVNAIIEHIEATREFSEGVEPCEFKPSRENLRERPGGYARD